MTSKLTDLIATLSIKDKSIDDIMAWMLAIGDTYADIEVTGDTDEEFLKNFIQIFDGLDPLEDIE